MIMPSFSAVTGTPNRAAVPGSGQAGQSRAEGLDEPAKQVVVVESGKRRRQ
jgi:hypothetical protein